MILPTDFRDNHATGFHGGNFFLREAAGRIRIGTGLADHTAAGAEWQKFRIKGAELFQEQMKMFLEKLCAFIIPSQSNSSSNSVTVWTRIPFL